MKLFKKKAPLFKPTGPKAIKAQEYLSEWMEEGEKYRTRARKKDRKETLLLISVGLGWLGLSGLLVYYFAGLFPPTEHRYLFKFFAFLMVIILILLVLIVDKYIKYKDYKDNIKWQHKDAVQGVAEAQFNLGEMYYYGEGVTQDYEKAFKWYEKAAKQGLVEAQLFVAKMSDKGSGVTQDFKKAFKWYSKASDQGNADAHYNIGMMYINGQGVIKDFKEASKWLRKAEEEMLTTEVPHDLGEKYYQEHALPKGYKETLRLLHTAADKSNTDALFRLGIIYKYGIGVSRDDQAAFGFFQNAAELGDTEAHFNLGMMYEVGRSVTRNYEKALQCYKKAAMQGSAESQYNLGWM